MLRQNFSAPEGKGDNSPPERSTMNGKPVYSVPAKTVLNMQSGFREKLLCDGPTFSMGDLCAYSCSFCYVPAITAKLDRVTAIGAKPQDIVVRRQRALELLRGQLVHPSGKLKFPDPNDRRVVFSSPLVDVAANMDLVRETVEACELILANTHWHIRLLSKSNLLPFVARGLSGPNARERVAYGVSTGTLNDAMARVFEAGTPLVSKRLASLHWLQDNGYRTYGMICPSLPCFDDAAYRSFAEEAKEAIRADRCEHVWAEVINVRGDSMRRTVAALSDGGFSREADLLLRVSTDSGAWEEYNRATFMGHADALHGLPGKLRYLTYVTKGSLDWWVAQAERGAVLLGKIASY